MEQLATRIQRMPPRLLLSHVQADTEAPARLELLASLPLRSRGGPEAALCVLVDPSEQVHTVVVVVDDDFVRPARPSDDWARGLITAAAQCPRHPSDGGFLLRRGDPALSTADTSTPASVVASDAARERWRVDDLAVTLERRPRRFFAEPDDPIQQARQAGFAFACTDRGELCVDDTGGGRWLGPVVRLTSGTPDGPLSDQLVKGLVAALRGHDSSAAMHLAEELGRVLASWHEALSTPTPSAPSPVLAATLEHVGAWRRGAANAVAAAAVLAETGSAASLRNRRTRLREAFETLDDAVGTPVVMGEGLTGMAAFTADVDPAGHAALSLDAVWPSPTGHAPAYDLAMVLRGIAHVAWATHRRLVASAEPAAVEEVADWENGMRELVSRTYLDHLRAAGFAGVFEPSLVRAFEVQLECESLVRSVRTLSAGTMVSDVALSRLLAL